MRRTGPEPQAPSRKGLTMMVGPGCSGRGPLSVPTVSTRERTGEKTYRGSGWPPAISNLVGTRGGDQHGLSLYAVTEHCIQSEPLASDRECFTPLRKHPVHIASFSVRTIRNNYGDDSPC